MSNQNIQIGIDLGTTNSEVAINRNGDIEIMKKPGGVEYTPSVFGFDKMKNKVVGQKAYERLYKDGSEEESRNNKAEVKRLMGTSEKVSFERVGLEMNAEEISAEILKSLKEDILRKYPDFDTTAAVITIPAHFSVLQAEATKRAGNLAGFQYVVLLQEPIAAAMSYGFLNEKNENWLIYDLGGGTFDVALVSSKDGILSVLSHNGDNFLGGKDIDTLIIDRIIVPEILEKYHLKEFKRNNEKYSSIFAKLKYLAENSKMYLSQYDSNTIEVDGIGNDDDGTEIYLTIDFNKKDFEKLIKHLIDKTIELSLETIKEAGIKASSISKIILVGGPTQIPYVKRRLEAELKILTDSSVDPLTVVARGACIYGLSQRIPEELMSQVGKKKSVKNSMHVRLNFDTLTSDTEALVSGTIDDLEDDNGEEHYIQFQSDSGFYSGSKIKVKNGKFFDNIALEPHKTNIFWVYLFNGAGETLPIDPDSFSITHGMSVSGTPISRSIGVGVAKRDFKSGFETTEVFEKFFEKGAILPLKKTETFKTLRKLIKKEDQNPLWIKVREGESEIPDRNIFICDLGINGSDLPYDLPEGTDVEITIEVNESREVFVTAYIPLLDVTLNARASFEDEDINLSQLEADFNTQSERAKKLEQTCSTEEKEKLSNSVYSVGTSLQNAHSDEDEKRKASKQLKDLKIDIDKMEKGKEMPQLVNDFNASIADLSKIIDATADPEEKQKLIEKMDIIKKEGSRAISENDKSLLVRVNEEIRDTITRVIVSDPSTWVYWFRKIKNENHDFKNETEARYYFDKGEKAIEANDIEELKRCVKNLIDLLPTENQQAIKNNISGITH